MIPITLLATNGRPASFRPRRIWLCAVACLALLVLATGVRAQECESCGDKDKDEVDIKFKAKACKTGIYTVTLAGAVAVGSGDSNQAPNYTNEVTASLKLDKRYELEVGTGTKGSYVNFLVPEGYVLEINGEERTTIQKNAATIGSLGNFFKYALVAAVEYLPGMFSGALKDKQCEGVPPGTGDGTWDVVLRKKCKKCSGGAASESCDIRAGSIRWSVNMGRLADGKSAQAISIREGVLSESIYTPAALVYSAPGLTTEVEEVRNPDGSLRQVKAPEALADVVVISNIEYDVRFYFASSVGAKVDGVYTVTGSPYVTWKIKNPNPATITQLEISRIQNGGTDTNNFTWDSATSNWTLTQGGGARIQTSTEVINGGTGDRTKTTTVKNSTNQVISKFVQTFHTFPWGEELIQEITDPDLAALTTNYAYYQNPAEDWRYGKVQSLTNPDGSWVKYDYDNEGNIILVMKPLKDLSLASATEANSDATRYYFTNNDGRTEYGFSRFVAMIQQKLAGTLVRQTNFYRTPASVVGEPAVREEQRVYSSSAATQSTFTTTYYSTASAILANRIASIEYSDGRQDSYAYEKGTYTTNSDPSLNIFTPDVNGTAERVTTIQSTTAAPDGIAFRTTKETSVSDESGHIVLQETYVYNGATYDRISWTVSAYNSRGQLTMTTRHTGQVSTSAWDDDRLISQIDEAGVETVYSNFDALGRARTVTKKGVAANGSFPAQPDIVTTYSLDPEGRTLSDTVTAGGLTLSKSRTYDVAGRIKTDTDQSTLTTNYAYTNGGRTETVTLPGGTATQITDKYLDGRIKSVTGTLTVARTYDYAVNTADGTKYTQEFIGTGGLSSPRWTKTTTDWMDRKIKVEKPTFTTGVTLAQSYIYNNKGQLQSESVATGATKVIADKLYEYDELGNQTRSGLDLDQSSALIPSSTDRIQETSTVYEKVGSDWFQTTTSKIYLLDNNATTTTTQIQRVRLNNFPVNGTEKTISEVTTTDIAGNQTKNSSAVDRIAKKLTATGDTPDSTTNAVSITINGLLQSSAATTPQTATTYSYDALGRLTSMVDPRSGPTTRSYNPATGQLSSETQGNMSTTYEYYPAANPSAGRIKAQTNAAGKKVYFNYSSRGELVQTWGDTTYPLEYVYDSYGQKTELHTFRAGSGWTGSTWPTATTGTADVTTSVYQDATGFLLQKQDAAAKQTVYTYDALGRIRTRVWARPGAITTTYSYEQRTGELTVADYSDATPDVIYVYDRGGRLTTVNDASGTHALVYNSAGALLTDQISGGILDNVSVSIGYDSFLRRNSVQSSRNAVTLSNQTYGYDTSSRLSTVTSGSSTATYAYYPTSGLLNTTTFTGGTSFARAYDGQGRVQTITNTPGGGGATSYTYAYNNLGQRTQVTREDNSYWSYLYNDRGELTSGKKYWADTTPVAAQQTEFTYDNIGNRSTAKAGGDASGANLRLGTYTPTSLNQYSQRTVPGAVDVVGTANSTATVTVNNQATYRKDTYFQKALALDNSAAPVYTQINVVGAKSNAGTNGEDAVSQQSGYAYLAKATELYTYDADGNLTSDGRWNYVWNAENRLVSMTAITAAPTVAKRRLEFTYDYIGRRVQKRVFAWNAGTSTYQLQAINKFIYHGWNLLAELDVNNALIRSYTWGPEGLVLINEAGNSYIPGYDGNQNVTSLVKTSNGTIAATYEYDPFGQTLQATGEYVGKNPFKFSTQYEDRETGLIYYGYRYYNPQTGRWTSRDPAAEAGGVNLYAFIRNDGINSVDLLGLARRSQIAGGGLTYSCNCGWIDWGHANPTAANSLWKDITNGGTQSTSGKGFHLSFSETAGIPMPHFGGYIIDFPTEGSYFVRHNLSVKQKESVALAIFQEVSVRFESGQRGMLGIQDKIMHSSFSEEDLVSNLIGFYRAVKGYARADIESWCAVIKDEAENYKVWDKTGGTKKNRSWTPVFHQSDCCGNPRWPSQFQAIHPAAKGARPRPLSIYEPVPLSEPPQPLWRDWTPYVDYIPPRTPRIRE
jgi:RHS repeat-associated protein